MGPRILLGNERGVALPLSLVCLVVLTALMVAFSVLATTEPMVASNHQRATQARALADSGLQLAIWALANSTNPAGIGAMLPGATMTAPYDGNSWVPVSGLGGFFVRVTYDAVLNTPTERTVTAVGWTPTKDGFNRNAHRKIHAVLQHGVVQPLDPPCVLCVAGEVQIAGSSGVFDSTSNGCGANIPPEYAIQTLQGTYMNAHPTVVGHGTSGAAAIHQAATNDAFRYSADSIAALKSIAQSNGTYYRGLLNSLPVSSGVIFVDTVDGLPYTSTTPDSNAGALDVQAGGTFTGVIIVMGSVTKLRHTTINGLLYAMNDLNIHGNVRINGAAISENRKDTSSSNVDTTIAGTVDMVYNCDNIRNIPGVSTAWVVKPGTYTEIEGH